MRLSNSLWIASAVACIVGGTAMTGLAQMDDDATTQPSAAAAPAKASAAKAKPAKAVRLVQPWSKVTDLTDEQKQQLYDIHADITAKKKALDAEEEEKCQAVLTEAQRTQLQETLEADKAARKTKAAEKKAGAADKAAD